MGQMQKMARLFVLSVLLATGNICFGVTVVSVASFGAKADDRADDTPAFVQALRACVLSPGSTLALDAGVYDVAMRSTPPDGSASPVLVISGARGLTIDGHGAEIICHDFATLFALDGCRDVTIRNLRIDYDPLPFTAGQIVGEGDGFVDLKIEPHHPLQAGLRAESLLPFDPVRKRMGQGTEDLYQPNLQRRTQKISPDVMRVPVTRPMYHPGDWVILRHQIYSKNALDFTNCDRVQFDDVTVYTCPGMALHAHGGSDFALHSFNVAIKPNSGRWFTATADATHFNGVRGKVTLNDCLLESMGDDGANVHNWYLRVTQVLGPRRFKGVLGKDPSWDPLLPMPGDHLEIGRSPNPLLPLINATVESAEYGDDGKAAVVTLTKTPSQPPRVDDVVGNASTLPALEVHHCTIRRNRARGVLVQTRGAVVEQCTFEDISGAAVQVTCDVERWWEGMPTRDVMIRDNTIARVNFGIGRRQAAIDIFADVGRNPAPEPVHRQIVVEHNTIRGTDGADIHVGSAEQVTIRRNRFDQPIDAAVMIDHSRDVNIARDNLAPPAPAAKRP